MKQPNEMNLNDQAKAIHQANLNWWRDINTGEPIQRNEKELLALVISEVIEALEGERKNLMDDKLPHRKMAEVEMADAKIRLLDFAGGFGIYIDSADSLPHPIDETPENKGEALLMIIEWICHTQHGGGLEISYALALIEAYCQKHGYDLHGAMTEKLAFNKSRADHSHEARRAAGGKTF